MSEASSPQSASESMRTENDGEEEMYEYFRLCCEVQSHFQIIALSLTSSCFTSTTSAALLSLEPKAAASDLAERPAARANKTKVVNFIVVVKIGPATVFMMTSTEGGHFAERSIRPETGMSQSGQKCLVFCGTERCGAIRMRISEKSREDFIRNSKAGRCS